MLSVDEIQKEFHKLHGRLTSQARAWASEFEGADPFPHVVIDDFLPSELAEASDRAFPPPESKVWQWLVGQDQAKKAVLSNDRGLEGGIRWLIEEFHSGAFLSFLERLTHIAGLIPDPKLLGGGLHLIKPGGRLRVHVDYSHHPETRLNRRLNLIVYLNKEWKEEYGGHLELWDREVKVCKRRIAPIFNRCIIFATSDHSFHGHPEPLSCPAHLCRRSIALYYYSNGRPEEKGKVVEHNTLFYPGPDEPFRPGNFALRALSSGFLRDLVPPLLYRFGRKIWNQWLLTRQETR